MFELFIDLAVVRVFMSKWGAEFIQYRPCSFSLHSTPRLLNHTPPVASTFDTFRENVSRVSLPIATQRGFLLSSQWLRGGAIDPRTATPLSWAVNVYRFLRDAAWIWRTRRATTVVRRDRRPTR